MAEKYAAQMKGLEFGYALRIPQSYERLQPGVCGYLDDKKQWHKMLDLKDDEKVSKLGYSSIPDLGSLVTDKSEWGPQTSATVEETTIEFSGGISAASFGLPIEARSAIKYHSGTDFGAILMCDQHVITEYYEHEHLLRSWLKQNAANMVKNFPDSEKHGGIYLVTKTFSSGDIHITIWDNKSHEVVIGAGADVAEGGKLDGSVTRYRATNSGGWWEYDGEKRVIFFSGILMKFEKKVLSSKLRLKDIPESEWRGAKGSFNTTTSVDDEGYVTELYEVSLEELGTVKKANSK